MDNSFGAMNYYLHKNGIGMLLTDWEPLKDTLTLSFNPCIEGNVTIRNNGRVYYLTIKGGNCQIGTNGLEGECNIIVTQKSTGARWVCESIFIDTKDGVKIAKCIDTRRIMANLRQEVSQIREEFYQLQTKMSALDKKVEFSIDGHDIL